MDSGVHRPDRSFSGRRVTEEYKGLDEAEAANNETS